MLVAVIQSEYNSYRKAVNKGFELQQTLKWYCNVIINIFRWIQYVVIYGGKKWLKHVNQSLS